MQYAKHGRTGLQVSRLKAAELTLSPALKEQLDALTVEYRRGDADR